jgi:inhibitor of KinA sporulation pathway (predicted exonuclease)
MGANLKTVFVVDVESTCWERDPDFADGELQGDQPNEIIEIGVAALDLKTGAIFQRDSIVVKPRFTKVSKFCTKLTGWTQEAIDRGVDITEALVNFRESFKVTKDHVWFSCGEYDRIKLSSLTGKAGVHGLYGIEAHSNPFDLMRSHVNIKTLFAMKYKLNRELGMDAMLKYIDETLQGQHHSGADDAFNIAKIVRKVLT